MATTLQYTLFLNDQMSAKLAKIGIGSDSALSKFAKLEKQSNDVKKLMGDMGKSVGTLREKLNLLRSEKEWIPASNLQSLKQYNSEIRSLEKEIARLENTGGSRLGQSLRGAIDSLPGAAFLTNPIVATGAALFTATKMSMDFDKGMAAINTTAQLSADELANLKKELMSIDNKYVDDWSAVPKAYESIISQTGDVKQSTEILKASLKGAKGGFTDVEVVSAALAQSLSLIGKENASAQEVLDTFFAAKRVGAGEFQDFAQYMPSLIASGDALGIKYKEVAGMFAYMTGKGQSAERSTVLMENAFSAMSKIDVRKNLQSEGINVFDENGSIRSMTSIFADLNKKMSSMNDEEKSSFLAKMGLTDKEARSAFIVLSGDVDKLKDSMREVKDSAGETDQAFKYSQTDADRLKIIWSQLQETGIALGGALANVLGPALSVVGWAAGIASDTLAWLFDGLASGDPVVYGLVAGVTALTVAMNWSTISMKAQDFWLNVLILKERIIGIWIKAKAVAMGIATGATWLWEAATMALNAAWAMSPIGMIILGVTALGAAVYGVTRLMNQQTTAERLNGEVKSRALEKTIEQKSELAILFDRLRQAKVGTDEYKKALQELGDTYPGIIEKYNLPKGSLDDINAAHRELVANIDAVAQQEARKEILKEDYKQMYENEKKARTGDYDMWAMTMTGLTGESYYVSENRRLKKDAKFLSNEIAANEIKTANAQGKLDKYAGGSGSGKANGQTTAEGKLLGVSGDDLQTEEAINKKIKELQDAKASMVIGGSDYKKTEKEIERLERKLGRSGGSGRSGVGSRSNEAIATGGAKQTTINMTIGNIIETITIAGKDFKEAADRLGEGTQDAVVRALNMATTTAG